MENEAEKIGVDVWVCVTIYVDAEDDDEAAKIVTERYAGTRTNCDTLSLLSGEDLPLDDEDFMSSEITLYGVAESSELIDASLAAAAPEMLEVLSHALTICEAEAELRGDNDTDDYAGGAAGPVAEWIRNVIAKAEGRTDG